MGEDVGDFEWEEGWGKCLGQLEEDSLGNWSLD